MTMIVMILAASLVLAAAYGVYATMAWWRMYREFVEAMQRCDEALEHCDQLTEILTDIAKGEADARIVNGNVVCQRREPRAPHRKTQIH